MQNVVRVAVFSLLLCGCSILGLGNPDVEISAVLDVPLPGYVFEVVIGRDAHALPLGSQTARYSREVETPGTGRLDVNAALKDPGGHVVAEASFEQQFGAGFNHWVGALIGERRPVGICIGELMAVEITPAVQPSRSDSLFIMYGRIEKGAIC